MWIPPSTFSAVPYASCRGETTQADKVKDAMTESVTNAVAIDATDTGTALLLDSYGRLRWRSTGPATPQSEAELRAALDTHLSDADVVEPLSIEQFDFAFDSRFRPLLVCIGVTPST